MANSFSSPWIESRLPDVNTVVIVHLPGLGAWIGYHDGEHWRFVDGCRADVLRWMPMPSVPEGEE